MHVLVTGGRGFIGHHLVEMLRRQKHHVFVADNRALPAAVNDPPEGVRTVWDGPLESSTASPHLLEVLRRYDITHVVHAAAHSHVDNSIDNPLGAMANVHSTLNLLEAARAYGKLRRLLYVSTDEVYGEIDGMPPASEATKVRPGNPYAASKAAAEAYCLAYRKTYGLNVAISRGCNTFGPRQTPDKFIPRMIVQAMRGEPLTLYGDGKHSREWMDVTSHARSLMLLLLADAYLPAHYDQTPIYNFTGIWTTADRLRVNAELAVMILQKFDRPLSLVQYVPDRPGHDRSYRLDGRRWQLLAFPRTFQLGAGFESYLDNTIGWYTGPQGQAWLAAIDADRFLVRRGLSRQEDERCTADTSLTAAEPGA